MEICDLIQTKKQCKEIHEHYDSQKIYYFVQFHTIMTEKRYIQAC